jgi:hypothetical protein
MSTSVPTPGQVPRKEVFSTEFGAGYVDGLMCACGRPVTRHELEINDVDGIFQITCSGVRGCHRRLLSIDLPLASSADRP